MIYYRQYVPKGTALNQFRINVAMELSRQASATDSPDEFFVEALGNSTERESRKGGTWVASFLDRPIVAEYANPLYSAPYKVPVPFAKDKSATDFNADMLAVHLKRKAARR